MKSDSSAMSSFVPCFLRVERYPRRQANARRPSRSGSSRTLSAGLEHAHVALGLVVVEGDGEVVEEGEHLVLPSQSRSSRLRAGDCLTRPRWWGRRSGGGLAACPAASSAR